MFCSSYPYLCPIFSKITMLFSDLYMCPFVPCPCFLKKIFFFSFHFFPSESCGILPLLLLFREKKNVLHKGLGNMWLHGLYFF